MIRKAKYPPWVKKEKEKPIKAQNKNYLSQFFIYSILVVKSNL